MEESSTGGLKSTALGPELKEEVKPVLLLPCFLPPSVLTRFVAQRQITTWTTSCPTEALISSSLFADRLSHVHSPLARPVGHRLSRTRITFTAQPRYSQIRIGCRSHYTHMFLYLFPASVSSKFNRSRICLLWSSPSILQQFWRGPPPPRPDDPHFGSRAGVEPRQLRYSLPFHHPPSSRSPLPRLFRNSTVFTAP